MKDKNFTYDNQITESHFHSLYMQVIKLKTNGRPRLHVAKQRQQWNAWRSDPERPVQTGIIRTESVNHEPERTDLKMGLCALDGLGPMLQRFFFYQTCFKGFEATNGGFFFIETTNGFKSS